MVAASDSNEADNVTMSYGPCLLGSFNDDIARKRGSIVANAIGAARNTELLVADAASDVAELLPADHRDSHSLAATTTETRAIEPILQQQEPSVVVVERESRSGLVPPIRGSRAEQLATKTDVLTVDGRGEAESIASILVPVAGGRHSQLAVEAAEAIGAAYDAAVDLFHVIESDTEAKRERGHQILQTAAAGRGDFGGGDTWLYTADSISEAIIEQSAYYDLTVMGAPTVGPLERFVFGSTAEDVQQGADSPLVVAHAHSPE